MGAVGVHLEDEAVSKSETFLKPCHDGVAQAPPVEAVEDHNVWVTAGHLIRQFGRTILRVVVHDHDIPPGSPYPLDHLLQCGSLFQGGEHNQLFHSGERPERKRRYETSSDGKRIYRPHPAGDGAISNQLRNRDGDSGKRRQEVMDVHDAVAGRSQQA